MSPSLNHVNDELMSRTENRRVRALAALGGGDQARLGQFFTPARAAVLIAGLPRLGSQSRVGCTYSTRELVSGR